MPQVTEGKSFLFYNDVLICAKLWLNKVIMSIY